MRTPSDDEILLAAEWLDHNEGDDGESESCSYVAEWLRVLVTKRNEERTVRALARDRGIPASVVRDAIRSHRAVEPGRPRK